MNSAMAQVDKTFSDVGETYRNCHLGWWGADTPHAICKGFKEVADLAVTASLEDPGHSDIYFRPVAFLYRHYLEVQLKRIIQLGDRVMLARDRTDAFATHDLIKLWAAVQQILNRVWPDADQSHLEPTDRVIQDFHELDENGQAFRYYTDRKGQPQLQRAPRVVSLQHLKQKMEDVYDFLSGCESGILHYLQEQP